MRSLFTASDIAEILAEPGAPVLYPTDEQRRVIEQPLGPTTLVIAGAGSGKTTTMANRVVWLVANGLVRAGGILGLTFTRKAAGELADRVRRQLMTFLEHAAHRGARVLSLEQQTQVERLSYELEESFEFPEISTFNAFAVSVLQEFGASAGLASGASLLDEAAAWNLAREVVLQSEEDELRRNDFSLTSLVDQVIHLDGAVHEHLTSFDSVIRHSDALTEVARLPYNDKELDSGLSGKLYADLRKTLQDVGSTSLIARLAAEFARTKQERGLLEYSDQVALALQTVERSPDAVEILAARSPVVLLDEMQDTSVGQTKLLSRIFAGNSVMAVGDPHQSIYGWRGASSSNLLDFHASFSRRGNAGETLTLSTSWRNARVILEAANVIAAPLRASSVIDVPTLQERPGVPQGSIAVTYPETIHAEFAEVAQWLATSRDEWERKEGVLPTAAVIMRSRKFMPHISAELTRHGIPNEIVGLGGLLTTPEVTDVVAVLRCLWYADANSELIRVLSGPRFRVGVADIHGLRRASRWFSGRDHTQQRVAEDERLLLTEDVDEVSLLDALDHLADSPVGHVAFRGITDTGRDRMIEAALLLRDLRSLISASIADLVDAIVHALRLDIELESNEYSLHEGAAARANLDSFVDVVENFISTDAEGSLRSLLLWLERTMRDDAVAEHVAQAEPGTVQIITGHSAKGLEWDLVAIPRLVTDEFPTRSRDAGGWLRSGALPDECRGDRHHRPRLEWRLAATQAELRARIADYREENIALHEDEERRLAYVALTRARHAALLSGAFWAQAKKPRHPSPYLVELTDAGLISGIPADSRHEEHPDTHREETLQWPLDPLGRRAGAVHAAADAVRRTLKAGPKRSEVERSVELLLQEAEARSRTPQNSAQSVNRVNASAFHEFIADPEAASRQRLRPIPARPHRNTRVGNLFHEWVERRTSTALGTAIPLAFEIETEASEEPEVTLHTEDASRALEDLQEKFERSRWAQLQPIAVEQEVSIPFLTGRIVCKLDAVYRIGERIEIVDWKTGRAPATAAERTQRMLQLDLYRHAYAAHSGVPVENIDVALFYVAEEQEIRGTAPRELRELEDLWTRAMSQA